MSPATPKNPPRAAEDIAHVPIWLLGATILGLFLGLGTTPLFDLDEGAFSAATFEMLQRGDYLSTWLNGEPRFDKPILIYWFQAASVSVLGLNEWGLRLPSAVAASIWLLAVYRFAQRFLGPDRAVMAAVMLGTSLVASIIARAATADALLNCLLTLTMLDLYRHTQDGDRASLLRVYLWMGLGLLTKGPVAVAIPLLVGTLHFAIGRDLRSWLRMTLNPLGWLILLAVAAPWYTAILLEHGQAFIDGFILKHNVGRFSDTMESHGGYWFYYLVALPLIVSPFAGWYLALLWFRVGRPADELDRWLWLWFAVVLVLVSLSSTQLPHYVLYGLPPVFVLMARHIPPHGLRYFVLALPLLGAMAVLVLPELLQLALPAIKDPDASVLIEAALPALDWRFRLAAGAAVLYGVVLLLVRRIPLVHGMLGAGLVQMLLVNLTLAPLVADVRQAPIKQAGLKARELGEPVTMYGLNMPSFTVYRKAITPRKPPAPGELVITRTRHLAEIGAKDILFSSNGIALARRDALPPAQR